MPELPEVETVRRGLNARVVGRRLTSVEVPGPLVVVGQAFRFVQAVRGRRIEVVQRKGKALAIQLGPQKGRARGGEEERCYLVVRLGMTGQFVVVRRDATLLSHTHVRMVLDGGTEEIRYRDPRRFGRLRCCTARELDDIFGRLGPDAPEVTEEQFLQAMESRRGAIKGWLLNQKVLAGLGNIYADEALFEAGIHPLAQLGRISPEAARRLLRAVKKVLARAIARQGTSFRDYLDIEGRPGNYAPRLRVYQRTGEPCRRCACKIQRLLIGGRSSHFCPHCQPRPRQARDLRLEA